MPIFFQQDIDAFTRLAVWQIAEPESFFLQAVPLQSSITHPHKRLQHLAGRYLLKHLFPEFPVSLIRIADTRKPFLEDEAFHFSITHCGDYAGVIVSSHRRVGIDLELVSEKVDRIRYKFMSAAEEKVLFRTMEDQETWTGMAESSVVSERALQLTTLLWSCKEAVFKWYGLGKVDFKEHIELLAITEKEGEKVEGTVAFKKNEDRVIDLHSRFFDGLCLSYIFT